MRCKRLVLNESFEPNWIRSPDSSYWIFSLGAPQQVKVQYQEVGSPRTPTTSYQIKLEGTGVLPISSSCYIHAENFKLLPHSLGRTTVNLFMAHIVLPNIETILNFSEEKMLQTTAAYTVDIQHLDDFIERVTSTGYTRGLDVNKVATVLRDREVYHQTSRNKLLIILLSLVAELGVLGLLWYGIMGRCGLTCNWRPLHTDAVTENQHFTTNDTRLQVELDKEGVELKTVEDDIVASPSTPTVFVPRGRLVFDQP